MANADGWQSEGIIHERKRQEIVEKRKKGITPKAQMGYFIEKDKVGQKNLNNKVHSRRNYASIDSGVDEEE